MLTRRIFKIWRNYFGGQFLITLITAAFSYISARFSGLFMPEVNAIFAGICENIPNFGAAISIMFSSGIALMKGSSKLDLKNWQFALITLGILTAFQLLQNNLISPLLIGKTVDIHPLLIFIGMVFFSTVFGVIGMFLAVPLMGTIRELVRYRFYYDEFYGGEG